MDQTLVPDVCKRTSLVNILLVEAGRYGQQIQPSSVSRLCSGLPSVVLAF